MTFCVLDHCTDLVSLYPLKKHRQAIESKSSSKCEDKGTSEENWGKIKGQSKGTRGAKGSHKGKTSKIGLSGLENSKSEASSDTQESAQTCPIDTSWVHDGWCPDEWNDGWSFLMNGMKTGVLLDGTKVGNKRMTLLQARFHSEVWISVPRVVRNDLNG